LRQQLEAERAQTARLAEVLAAQPVTVRELRGTGAPQAGGRLTIAPDGQAAVLTARDLPPLLAGHVYQVWLVRNGQRTSGGVFTVEDGAGWLLVQAPESLRVYQAIGITVEPAPGSPGPTSPQVMGGTLQ
jgi:anti-sigma-K factor RskA